MGANICKDDVPGCRIRKYGRCTGDRQSWFTLSAGGDSDLAPSGATMLSPAGSVGAFHQGV